MVSGKSLRAYLYTVLNMFIKLCWHNSDHVIEFNQCGLLSVHQWVQKLQVEKAFNSLPAFTLLYFPDSWIRLLHILKFFDGESCYM